VALLGLGTSVAGNIGHVAGHDLQSRGTAAVPPVAAFAAMWVGLSVLKRVIARAEPEDDEIVHEESVARVPLTVVPDVVSSPVPSDAETAAAEALRATLAAGNPLSMNQLRGSGLPGRRRRKCAAWSCRGSTGTRTWMLLEVVRN
jgi:hypothetical protein